MSTTLTFLFNDIFKNYSEWEYWSRQVGVIDFNKNEDILFDKYCYKILSRHFCNQSIRYNTIDEFLLELALVYENKFNQFKMQKRLIDNIHKLSNEEIETLNESLTNMANNPNTAPDNPRQPLKYISAQTFGVAKKGKLQAYLDAINNIPTLKVFDFINKSSDGGLSFKDLFMIVQPINYYVYGGNKDA